MPLSLHSSIYASHDIITDVSLGVRFCFVCLITAPSSMGMSLRPPETFMLPHILLRWHPITSTVPRFDNQLTKTGRQVCLAFRKFNMFLGHVTSVFLIRVIYFGKIYIYLVSSKIQSIIFYVCEKRLSFIFRYHLHYFCYFSTVFEVV